MLEKTAAIKRFEYSQLGKELIVQTSAAEKRCKKLDKVFESVKTEEKILKARAKSNLVYSKDFTFYKNRNTIKFAKRSFYSKQNDFLEFKDILELFYDDTEEINEEGQIMKIRKKNQKKEKLSLIQFLNYMTSF